MKKQIDNPGFIISQDRKYILVRGSGDGFFDNPGKKTFYYWNGVIPIENLDNNYHFCDFTHTTPAKNILYDNGYIETRKRPLFLIQDARDIKNITKPYKSNEAKLLNKTLDDFYIIDGNVNIKLNY